MPPAGTCVLPRRCFGLRVLRRQTGAAPHFSSRNVPVSGHRGCQLLKVISPADPDNAPCRPVPVAVAGTLSDHQAYHGMAIATKPKPRWDVHLWDDEPTHGTLVNLYTPVHNETIRERQRASVVCVFHLGFSLGMGS